MHIIPKISTHMPLRISFTFAEPRGVFDELRRNVVVALAFDRC